MTTLCIETLARSGRWLPSQATVVCVGLPGLFLFEWRTHQCLAARASTNIVARMAIIKIQRPVPLILGSRCLTGCMAEIVPHCGISRYQENPSAHVPPPTWSRRATKGSRYLESQKILSITNLSCSGRYVRCLFLSASPKKNANLWKAGSGTMSSHKGKTGGDSRLVAATFSWRS
jgi:hypothetical protein